MIEAAIEAVSVVIGAKWNPQPLRGSEREEQIERQDACYRDKIRCFEQSLWRKRILRYHEGRRSYDSYASPP